MSSESPLRTSKKLKRLILKADLAGMAAHWSTDPRFGEADGYRLVRGTLRFLRRADADEALAAYGEEPGPYAGNALIDAVRRKAGLTHADMGRPAASFLPTRAKP